MPRNMTMHQPCARIIRNESEHEPSIRRQGSSVTARRVDIVQGIRGRVAACSRSQHVKVVAVEVHRVSLCGGLVGHGLNNPEGPDVGTGEVDEVHGARKRSVALANILDGWFVPGCLDRGEVEIPLRQRLTGGHITDDGEADVQAR